MLLNDWLALSREWGIEAIPGYDADSFPHSLLRVSQTAPDRYGPWDGGRRWQHNPTSHHQYLWVSKWWCGAVMPMLLLIEEIRRAPVKVGSLSQYFTGFFTSQVFCAFLRSTVSQDLTFSSSWFQQRANVQRSSCRNPFSTKWHGHFEPNEMLRRCD